HLPGRHLPASAGHRRVQADPRRTDAHPVSRGRSEAVLHLPQPRIPAVAAWFPEADTAGMGAVRLVLPRVAPRRCWPARMGSVAPLGETREVWEARTSGRAKRRESRMTFVDAAAQSRTFARA